MSVFTSPASCCSVTVSGPPPGVPQLSSVSYLPMKVQFSLVTMRPNVASGSDGISSRMLRMTEHTISSRFTTLSNHSLHFGKVPSGWKQSSITPIFKYGDPSDVSNCRPISLLPLVSKVLERQVHDTIMQHLCAHQLLSSKQFGFRPGASTQEAILSMTRKWHETLECGESLACVFFDISKALTPCHIG